MGAKHRKAEPTLGDVLEGRYTVPVLHRILIALMLIAAVVLPILLVG